MKPTEKRQPDACRSPDQNRLPIGPVIIGAQGDRATVQPENERNLCIRVLVQPDRQIIAGRETFAS